MVCIILDGRREQGVDKGRLSKAGFTCNLGHISLLERLIRKMYTYHDGERSSTFSNNLVPGHRLIES